MTNKLTTTVNVNFGTDGPSEAIRWESDPDREPTAINHKIMRLYPSGVPITFATSGSLSGGAAHTDNREDILVFNNGDNEDLPYPHAFSVSMSLIGRFYDPEGNPINGVTFSYDTLSNTVSSSHVGYGVVEVKYKTKYDLYHFRFSGIGCPDSPTATAPDTPYNPSMLVAIDPSIEETATSRMSPPTCKSVSLSVKKGPEAEAPDIDLIVDPEYDEKLRKEKSESNKTKLTGKMQLRLIPDVTASVQVSSKS